MRHTQWAFIYVDIEGNNTLSQVYNFGRPVTEEYALTFTTQFVRDNYISSQAFDY